MLPRGRDLDKPILTGYSIKFWDFYIRLGEGSTCIARAILLIS